MRLLSSILITLKKSTQERVAQSPTIRAAFLQINSSLSKSSTQVERAVVPPQLTAQTLAQFLGEQGMCWIIEDFHKMDATEKLPFAQSMKVFCDMSAQYPDVKTVTIGATDTARQVVEYDPEMSKRVSEIHVPLMTPDELTDILINGQRLLNIDLTKVGRDIVEYSAGMPSVCHQIALNTCLARDILESQRQVVKLDRDDLKPALSRYADESSDTLKANFARALGARAVRKYDNYRLILTALAGGPLPGMTPEEILSKIHETTPSYPKKSLRPYLKELGTSERGRLIHGSIDGKWRFVESIYYTFAQAVLISPEDRKLARGSGFLDALFLDVLTSKIDKGEDRSAFIIRTKEGEVVRELKIL